MPPIVPRLNRPAVDIDTALAKLIVQTLLLDEAEAKDNLLEAKVQQAFYANNRRGTEVIYKVGDRVMLLMMNRRALFKKKDERRVAKFFPRWDGPYTVLDTHPECSMYTIDMPNQPNVFHMFHSGELKPHVENDPVLFPGREYEQPGPVVTSEGLEEFEIDQIIDAKRHGRGWRYLVRWVGYGPDHDRWLPGAELAECEALDDWFTSGGDGPERIVNAEGAAVAVVLFKKFSKTAGDYEFSDAGRV